MIKLYFCCSWGESSEKLIEKYSKLTPKLKSEWNNLQATNNINEADWIIIVDDLPNNINLENIDLNKIITIPREPYRFNFKYDKYNIKFKFNYDNFFHCWSSVTHILYDYKQLLDLKFKEKNKLCSGVVSKLIQKNPKQARFAYENRVNFIRKLCQTNNNNIDIYGYNWTKKELGDMYKGTLGGFNLGTAEVIDTFLENTTKMDGLYPYKYTLALENCVKKNYFSEKFTDAILAWTIPIYYGCPNINDFFPKECYYTIDINDPRCIEKINEIIKKPITDKQIEAMKIARDLILNKYNIWSTLENIIINNI